MKGGKLVAQIFSRGNFRNPRVRRKKSVSNKPSHHARIFASRKLALCERGYRCEQTIAD
jgi:hypothetical protein